jgi:hypothetical protein
MVTSPKNRKKTPMSDDHKAALARGREEGAAVRRYLEALESSKPARGRKRTPESISKRLAAIEEQIPYAGSLQYLQLLQEQSDLEAELARGDQGTDIAAIEEQFVKVAASYGDRKHLAYSTWRTAGVSADVLRRAGIARTRG